ncbi:hypothetical protein ABZ297_07660 [Nonomuraea sp. NPDC005983]|uniref:hypothetical protein n=1 Tax=Nonomuraea sp. NPDC005983 TaxID=3155595 RepID=UPI00339FEB3B
MSEETRSLRAAPDLAARVTARTTRRTRQRRLVVVAVAAVLVALGGVPAYLAASEPDQVASSLETLDGVRIGYLPEGMGRPQRLRVREGGLRGTALRWQDGPRFVQVSAYRAGTAVNDSMDILALNIVDSPVEPRTLDAPVLSGDGTSLYWVADSGLILKVAVSPDLKQERDRIAGGLRVVASPFFAGMLVAYLPHDLEAAGVIDQRDGILSRSWQGESGQRVEVEVVYGRTAATLDRLRAAGSPDRPPRTVRRTSVQGSPAYEGVTGQGDRMMLWLVKPGIGVRVSAGSLPDGELARIVDGIRPRPERQGESVDGIGISFPRPALKRDLAEITMGPGWRATTQRWNEGAVAVSVQRGGAVGSSLWWQGLSRTEPERATVAGVQGMLLNPGGSGRTRRFAWTPEVGLGIVVTASVSDLDGIVRGVRAS